MKKLIPNKKNYVKNQRYTQFKSDPPKRTVTSTWNARNDSSNITSILQPENYINSPKEPSDQGVYKKCFLGENTCYCVETKVRPKLMPRPRTCLSLDNLRKVLEKNDLQRMPLEQDYVYEECCCKDVADGYINSTGSALLKRYQELENNCTCLKYTDSRKDCHKFRQEQNEEYLKEVEEFNESEDTAKDDKEEDHGEKEEDYSLSTIMGTRRGTTKTTLSFDSDDQVTTAEDLNAFRNDHYFETHSTDDLGRPTPKHTCVHQFRLDDRLLPEPVNVDPFGRSRCSVCSRPMEGDTMQLSKSYFGGKPSSVTLRNLAKCSELGLAPRSISIGGDRSKIELRVDGSERGKLGMIVGKMRKPEYFNTFALRQQRMSC